MSYSCSFGLYAQAPTTKKTPIGQRFIFSLPKTHDKSTLELWLQRTKPAGVMLEAWHMSNRSKIKETIENLQALASKIGIPPLFVAVDWEGGIVSRANEAGGFASVPAPYNFAQGGRSSCFLTGKLIGRQLRSVGASMVFAPSLDLFDPNNYVLATRCLSSDPVKVFECGLAFARGLISEGVMPVIKHFPGLGCGLGDTHLVDVKIDLKEADFQKHVSPFIKALDENLPAVMVSHAEYSNFDNKSASKSEVVVNFLRDHNADVILITDDIAMLAFNNEQKKIKVSKSFLDDVMTSLKAGFHLLIFSELPEKQCALVEALEDLEAQRQLVNHDAIVEKINTAKKTYKVKEAEASGDFDEKELAQELAAKANVQHVSIDGLANKRVLLVTVDLPKIRTSEAWFISQKNSYLGSLLKNKVSHFLEAICDAKDNSSVASIAKLVALAKKSYYDVVILQTFFYGQGEWNKNQEEWLKKLDALSDRLIVFSLGHPREQQVLGKLARIINLGAFHMPDIDVACERLFASPALTGAERLMLNPERFLKKKHIALLCHNCSYIKQQGHELFLPDVLLQWVKQQDDSTRLVALFSPEHGLLGSQEAAASVESESVSKWGCPIYSLHGKFRKPTDEMLDGIDLLLVDLQEVGVRCYTYLSTMALTLEAAAKKGIEVIVLDRPNPLKALGAQGPMLDASCESFLGKISVPFVHGQTMGGLAKFVNEKHHLKLSVLDCIGTCDEYFGANFRAPSPNLSTHDALFAYPMTVVIEGTNYSEGRGTSSPFQQIGAPWINAQLVAKTLNEKHLPGVYFEPVEFKPTKIKGVAENPKHLDQLCQSVFIHVLDRDVIKPVEVAHNLLTTLFFLYPEQSKFLQWGGKYAIDSIIGTHAWREEIMGNKQLIS